jgi:hypothetical protein
LHGEGFLLYGFGNGMGLLMFSGGGIAQNIVLSIPIAGMELSQRLKPLPAADYLIQYTTQTPIKRRLR